MKKYNKPPVWRGIAYYLRCIMRGRPNLVNIEVTKRCNAKCDFCGYWEEKGPPELDDYSPIVKAFRPVLTTFSGGEPLIRRNLHEIAKAVRPYCHYLTLVTNGTLLSETRAEELFSAGVDKISVSLDYLDERHDKKRGVPGLFEKIRNTVPAIVAGGGNIIFNTVIMDSNLDQIIPLAKKAHEWGVGISFSTYCHLKKNDLSHHVSDEKFHQLETVIKKLKEMKKRTRHIKNSNYYLDRIPIFVQNGEIPDCKAGKKWIQVTPDGYLKPCSELGQYCHFSEYSKNTVPDISCTKCWYACRGESEANHLAPRRVMELIKA